MAIPQYVQQNKAYLDTGIEATKSKLLIKEFNSWSKTDKTYRVTYKRLRIENAGDTAAASEAWPLMRTGDGRTWNVGGATILAAQTIRLPDPKVKRLSCVLYRAAALLRLMIH